MKKISILIIDDDDITLFIMKKTIEKTGYEVELVTKSDGNQALQYLDELVVNKATLPQLIFVDINMPVMNGWEFMDWYEHSNIDKKVSLFMLSSSVYDIDLEKAKTFKTVQGFISKPISIAHTSEIFEEIAACSAT